MSDHVKLNALGWNLCGDTMMHQLTATTYDTGKIFECPPSALPTTLQKVPGLSTIYLSGYVKPLEVMPALSATGEIVTVRLDQQTIKTYNYVFAVTDDQKVYWIGPFKDFDLHHIPLGSEVPVEALFGNNPISPTPKS
jgi:hypothetical protein